MKLSPHFSLEELTTTSHKDLDNTPSEVVVARLKTLASRLETVRDILGGHPIHINSAYRSPKVNKAVGSKPTSAHIQGWAVDFVVPEFGTPAQIARKLVGTLDAWDQIIYEGTWVHLSIDPRNRRQILTYGNGKYRQGIDA